MSLTLRSKLVSALTQLRPSVSRIGCGVPPDWVLASARVVASSVRASPEAARVGDLMAVRRYPDSTASETAIPVLATLAAAPPNPRLSVADTLVLDRMAD